LSLEQALPAKHTEALAERTEAPAADTELVGDADLEVVEERLQAPADGGVALEPFNLEQERAEGFFDEEGHYVEKKDEEERDAWLASGEGARHRRRLFAAELTGILAGRPYVSAATRAPVSPAENSRSVVFAAPGAARGAGSVMLGSACLPAALTKPRARVRRSGGGQRARAPPDRRARARNGGRGGRAGNERRRGRAAQGGAGGRAAAGRDGHRRAAPPAARAHARGRPAGCAPEHAVRPAETGLRP